MVAKVGRDEFGAGMVDNFGAKNVGHAHVTAADAPTGCALITVGEAENTIVIVPGANAELKTTDVEAARDILDSADVVLCQMEVPCEASLRAFELAPRALKVLNAAPIPAAGVPAELVEAADLVCPNEVELAVLTGKDTSDVAAAAKAARQLARGKVVLATLGSNGALLVDGGIAVHVPAVDITAVDTTGAGDSFLGAFAAFVAAGANLLEATRDATAVAAYSVQRPGTQPAYPTLDDLPAKPAFLGPAEAPAWPPLEATATTTTTARAEFLVLRQDGSCRPPL
ncbi:hypothetical protein CTAYLR_004980 [Chrysophaeum taylorii]|uniref:Carbohydrate kinase PfkB domain-containing protein n=1 Tax=Chrysophaeum taylorii TaxID=2483200 RepID=A0AAD7UPF0_9STRA|nr:hypothetical protein CTAYLR_004980 [Chrysophaeum taylorii]